MDEKTMQKQEAMAKAKEENLLSLRDRILASKDISSELVTVPEWGDVTIEIRSPTVRERGEMISEFMSNDNTIDYVRMYPTIIVATAFDPATGERIFSREDNDWLRDRSSVVMERLGQVAMRLSGLQDAEARVELGKDASSPTRNGSTSSD